jgi:hypothetical protein
LQRDVTLTAADPATRDLIDVAYRTKYGRYGDSYLQTMLGEQAVASTMKLIPLQPRRDLLDPGGSVRGG